MNKIIIYIIVILIGVIVYYSNFLIEKVEQEQNKHLKSQVTSEKKIVAKPAVDDKSLIVKMAEPQKEAPKNEVVKKEAPKNDVQEEVIEDEVSNDKSEEEAVEENSSNEKILAEESYEEVLKLQQESISEDLAIERERKEKEKREKEKAEAKEGVKSVVPVFQTAKEMSAKKEKPNELPRQPLMSQPAMME